MTIQSSNLILLALLWLGYFLIHSALASLAVKQWLANRYPQLTPWYRILFNLQSTLLLIPPLAMTWALRSEPLWAWQGIWSLLAYALMLLACLGFAWSLKFYDGQEFLGFRQLARQQQQTADQEQLHISPMHRYVRHPWYSLGLLLVWTQEMDPARLVSAVCITLYLLLGSRYEENKLMVFHGEVYRAYRQKVPGLIPRPWRYLSESEARELQHR
jgi:protein-S-isoprenylcysteine O-methyltransferase Ste14